MRHRSRTLLGCFFASLLMGGAVHGQGGTSPGYKNVKLAAGNYLVEFGKDGSIRLRGVGGGGAIAIAPADTVPQDTGGGPLKCGTSTRIVIRGYPGGKICLYLVCEGTWWYPLGCFTIRPPKFPWPF